MVSKRIWWALSWSGICLYANTYYYISQNPLRTQFVNRQPRGNPHKRTSGNSDTNDFLLNLPPKVRVLVIGNVFIFSSNECTTICVQMRHTLAIWCSSVLILGVLSVSPIFPQLQIPVEGPCTYRISTNSPWYWRLCVGTTWDVPYLTDEAVYRAGRQYFPPMNAKLACLHYA